MSDFIGIYENALSAEYCQSLIQKFETDSRTRAGATGQGVDKAKKDSLDITLDQFQDWHEDLGKIHQATVSGLMQYARAYPHLVVGAVALTWQPPGATEARPIRAEDIADMDDALLMRFINAVFRTGTTNLQKYNKGSGGYHHWHSEHFPSPHDPANSSLHRVLLWMYYLNDVPKGGGTSFYYQDKTISPKQGTLVIAPASFTHTHRGEIPVSNDKYILTSWILWQDRQALYGKGG